MDPQKLSAIASMLRRRCNEVNELRQVTTRTIPILRQMLEHQRDRIRMDKLFEDLGKCQQKVARLKEVFDLVNSLNTIGAFRRARMDRAILHASGDDFERQQRQLERDIDNLDWLVQACDEATSIFRAALERVESKRKSEAGLRAKDERTPTTV
jgi:hypothetical protein